MAHRTEAAVDLDVLRQHAISKTSGPCPRCHVSSRLDGSPSETTPQHHLVLVALVVLVGVTEEAEEVEEEGARELEDQAFDHGVAASLAVALSESGTFRGITERNALELAVLVALELVVVELVVVQQVGDVQRATQEVGDPRRELQGNHDQEVNTAALE